MRSRIAVHTTALGALLAACTAAPQPAVPLVGGAGDIAALVGRWEGGYSSAATGRSGTISFTLSASGDSAVGDVVMIPRGFGRPLQAWDRPATATGVPQLRPAVLTINFVRVAGGGVAGTLAPYADPETGTQLFTSFQGRLSGDRIEGTYTTRTATGADTQTGAWEVTRHRS